MKGSLIAIITMLAVLGAGVHSAAGQVLKRLKDRAQDKVEEKLGEKQDEAIDRTLDGKPTGGDQTGGTSAGESPTAVSGSAEEATSLKPGEGAWSNYDFIPGEHVLVYEDYMRDNVGDFPRRLGFEEGSYEIVEWQGRRFLKSTAFGSFNVPLPQTLPDRFTIEFQISGPGGWAQEVYFSGDNNLTRLSIMPSEVGLDGPQRSKANPSRDLSNKLFTVRLMADGQYVKVFVDEQRVSNAPNATLGRSDKVTFKLRSTTDYPVMIGPISVNAGVRKLYDVLAAEGRVATQGIYFDVGSDRIRPESTPTLKEIGNMLKEHGDLRLKIEGHTDNTGNADANQRLSEMRAAAVKTFLVSTFQIDGSRLEAEGFGPSNPAASNDTPEGRQINRRVELVKL